jgi:hypothetical protein
MPPNQPHRHCSEENELASPYIDSASAVSDTVTQQNASAAKTFGSASLHARLSMGETGLCPASGRVSNSVRAEFLGRFELPLLLPGHLMNST